MSGHEQLTESHQGQQWNLLANPDVSKCFITSKYAIAVVTNHMKDSAGSVFAAGRGCKTKSSQFQGVGVFGQYDQQVAVGWRLRVIHRKGSPILTEF
jgi:hypothetical protein